VNLGPVFIIIIIIHEFHRDASLETKLQAAIIENVVSCEAIFNGSICLMLQSVTT